jgi:hypothetical protein
VIAHFSPADELSVGRRKMAQTSLDFGGAAVGLGVRTAKSQASQATLRLASSHGTIPDDWFVFFPSRSSFNCDFFVH